MQDATLYLTMAATTLAGLAIIAVAALRGWNGWLDLKRAELWRTASRSRCASLRARGRGSRSPTCKERIRKLEAIAAGVDL